jgi:hypothetical protein
MIANTISIAFPGSASPIDPNPIRQIRLIRLFFYFDQECCGAGNNTFCIATSCPHALLDEPQDEPL